jgi:hypothetical protein
MSACLSVQFRGPYSAQHRPSFPHTAPHQAPHTAPHQARPEAAPHVKIGPAPAPSWVRPPRRRLSMETQSGLTSGLSPLKRCLCVCRTR